MTSITTTDGTITITDTTPITVTQAPIALSEVTQPVVNVPNVEVDTNTISTRDIEPVHHIQHAEELVTNISTTTEVKPLHVSAPRNIAANIPSTQQAVLAGTTHGIPANNTVPVHTKPFGK